MLSCNGLIVLDASLSSDVAWWALGGRVGVKRMCCKVVVALAWWGPYWPCSYYRIVSSWVRKIVVRERRGKEVKR